ncbi:MAG: hypothetical protein WD035_11100 [Balneolaceae bacterium]
MLNTVESYKLGKINVTITETEDPKRLKVDCNDGEYHSEFTVSRYEYQNYKRHMNQKITKAYQAQYDR